MISTHIDSLTCFPRERRVVFLFEMFRVPGPFTATGRFSRLRTGEFQTNFDSRNAIKDLWIIHIGPEEERGEHNGLKPLPLQTELNPLELRMNDDSKEVKPGGTPIKACLKELDPKRMYRQSLESLSPPTA